ncbi:hypothetical protein BH11PSE1_BH11PSE1_16430 [soil metagenome]
MGSRNLDRRTIHDFRRGGETVGDMYQARWRIRSYCPDCGLTLNVSLVPYIAIRGPTFSLWDKTTRCLNARCRSGRATFYGLARGMTGFHQLRSPDPSEAGKLGWAQQRLADMAAANAKPPDLDEPPAEIPPAQISS